MFKAYEQIELAVITTAAIKKLFFDDYSTLTFTIKPMEQHITDIENFIHNATTDKCVELLRTLSKDIELAIKPDAIHVKLRALALEMDLEDYRKLLLTQLLNSMAAVKSKLHTNLGIKE
jgi:hypothetical protein